MKRVWITLAGLLVAVAFAWLVWPTPWRYQTVHPIYSTGTLTIRTNRLTGQNEYFNLIQGDWEIWRKPSPGATAH